MNQFITKMQVTEPIYGSLLTFKNRINKKYQILLYIKYYIL